MKKKVETNFTNEKQVGKEKITIYEIKVGKKSLTVTIVAYNLNTN